MKNFLHRRPGLFPVVGLALFLGMWSPPSIFANVLSWTGGGATGNWNDSGNWGFIGTPASGDTVSFPGGQPRLNNTNNISGLVLNQIRFVGSSGGYILYGNAVTLTNSIEATNNGANIINFSITNSIALSPTNITIDVGSAATLGLGGFLYGTASITKAGTGGLIYQAGGSNPYIGATRVNAGILYLNVGGSSAFGGPLIIGDGTGAGGPTVRLMQSTEISDNAPITINKNGLLDLSNFFETIGTNVTMNGNATISTGTGLLSLLSGANVVATGGFSAINGRLDVGSTTCNFSNTFVLTINATISGSAKISKLGTGDLHFSNSNSYSGLTVVQQGLLFVENSFALGGTNNGTVVGNGGSLSMVGVIGITNETLSLTGPGSESDFGTLDGDVSPGTNTWAGPITVNGGVVFSSAFANGTLNIAGLISGPGSVTVGADFNQGNVLFSGTNPNSYLGSTLVKTNLTLLLKGSPNTAIPGNVEIAGTVRLLADEQISNAADVQVDDTGLLDFAVHANTIDTLHGKGQVTFGNTGFLNIGNNNGSSTFDGLISGVGYPGGYTVGKFGTGKFTMTANNTYQNLTHVFTGAVLVNGSQPQSSVIVESGATIGGSGIIGGIFSVGGIVSPGNSPGVLTCASNVTLNSSSTFLVDLTGPNAGTNGYDALHGQKTNALGNAILTINQALTAPLAVGSVLQIMNAASIQGTFAGLPNGAIFSIGGYSYQISYTATVVNLTVLAIPGAFNGASVASGNGNHAIDPNECNNLFLVVSNTSGGTLTGVTASLANSFDGSHAFLTEPNSSYPDIPAHGIRTNITPFQLSTLPGFSCGDSLSLTLSVFSAQGSFLFPVTLQSSGTPGTPVRYDNSSTTPIPDVGSVDSTNVVSGFTGPIEKVTVALYITHAFDGDLTNISLIGPDNTTVKLAASNGGSGANFGSSCSDASRTTFDDAAGTSIAAGSAPFVGTFVPLQPLATFIGKNGAAVNGNWRLRIGDGFGGSLGTLRCWSLFLSPAFCPPGGGSCAACYGIFTNTINNSDLLNNDRISRNSIVSSCAVPKACPGGGNEPSHYDLYNFTNHGAATCVTVSLDDQCGTLFSVAYLGSYDTNNICANYLGDIGNNVASSSYSISVPANTNFIVVVNEVPLAGSPCDYTLMVTASDCQPRLSIARDPAGTNNVRLFWTSAAGGYNLESTPTLVVPAWSTVTNEPIISGTNYNVTNGIVGTNKFYRLHKP